MARAAWCRARQRPGEGTRPRHLETGRAVLRRYERQREWCLPSARAFLDASRRQRRIKTTVAVAIPVFAVLGLLVVLDHFIFGRPAEIAPGYGFGWLSPWVGESSTLDYRYEPCADHCLADAKSRVVLAGFQKPGGWAMLALQKGSWWPDFMMASLPGGGLTLRLSSDDAEQYVEVVIQDTGGNNARFDCPVPQGEPANVAIHSRHWQKSPVDFYRVRAVAIGPAAAACSREGPFEIRLDGAVLDVLPDARPCRPRDEKNLPWTSTGPDIAPEETFHLPPCHQPPPPPLARPTPSEAPPKS